MENINKLPTLVANTSTTSDTSYINITTNTVLGISQGKNNIDRTGTNYEIHSDSQLDIKRFGHTFTLSMKNII